MCSERDLLFHLKRLEMRIFGFSQKESLESRVLPWQQHTSRCHSNSFVMYISGTKFEEHCSNIFGDIVEYLKNDKSYSTKENTILPVYFEKPCNHFLLKTYGERAFSVAAPRLWNKIRLSSSEAVFKANLKTYLFKGEFDSVVVLFVVFTLCL